MSEIDLRKLREIAMAATHGEWRQGNVEKYNVFVECREPECLGTERVLLKMNTHFDHVADARHIAAFCPATAIALLDEVERLRKERDGYVDAIMSGPVASRIINAHVIEAHERQEDEIAKLRAHLKTALRDVDDWKRRWDEVSPTGPDNDLALHAGQLTAERDALRAQLAQCQAELAGANRRASNTTAEIADAVLRDTIIEHTTERIVAHLKSIDPNTPVGLAWIDIKNGAWRSAALAAKKEAEK